MIFISIEIMHYSQIAFNESASTSFFYLASEVNIDSMFLLALCFIWIHFKDIIKYLLMIIWSRAIHYYTYFYSPREHIAPIAMPQILVEWIFKMYAYMSTKRIKYLSLLFTQLWRAEWPPAPDRSIWNA